MQVEVELRQFVGRKKGLLVTLPLDFVYLKHRDEWVKVGQVKRMPGAVLIFTRFFGKELRSAIQSAVNEQRTATEFGPIMPFTASIPNPQEVKSYLKGEIKRKKKTFSPIVAPDGQPFKRTR